jgi:hypothetical protein
MGSIINNSRPRKLLGHHCFKSLKNILFVVHGVRLARLVWHPAMV